MLYQLWPDWAIYWTLANFSKSLATINLPKSPSFSGNFVKVSKTIIFLVKSFLGNFYRHLAIFFWSHCQLFNFYNFATSKQEIGCKKVANELRQTFEKEIRTNEDWIKCSAACWIHSNVFLISAAPKCAYDVNSIEMAMRTSVARCWNKRCQYFTKVAQKVSDTFFKELWN